MCHETGCFKPTQAQIRYVKFLNKTNIKVKPQQTTTTILVYRNTHRDLENSHGTNSNVSTNADTYIREVLFTYQLSRHTPLNLKYTLNALTNTQFTFWKTHTFHQPTSECDRPWQTADSSSPLTKQIIIRTAYRSNTLTIGCTNTTSFLGVFLCLYWTL